MVDDDIKDDIDCARKIYQVHGFEAWVAWKYKCKGRNLKNFIKGCTNIKWAKPIDLVNDLLIETEKRIQTIGTVPKTSNGIEKQFTFFALQEVANYLSGVLNTMNYYFKE